jgi:hypothetical protein
MCVVRVAWMQRFLDDLALPMWLLTWRCDAKLHKISNTFIQTQNITTQSFKTAAFYMLPNSKKF